MKTYYLLSCVSKKRASAAAARDLYISDWFKKARSYVEKSGESWFILSAEHGLLSPDQIIVPYEKTLNSMPIHQRRTWSVGVLQALERFIEPGDTIIFLAGFRYRQFLMSTLLERGIHVKVPLGNKPIGKQLQWLKENTHD